MTTYRIRLPTVPSRPKHCSLPQRPMSESPESSSGRVRSLDGQSSRRWNQRQKLLWCKYVGILRREFDDDDEKRRLACAPGRSGTWTGGVGSGPSLGTARHTLARLAARSAEPDNLENGSNGGTT